MNIIISQHVKIREGGVDTKTGQIFTKNIEVDFVPRQGDFIVDSAFCDKEHAVTKVLLDFQNEEYTVHITDYDLDIQLGKHRSFEVIKELYEFNKWKAI